MREHRGFMAWNMKLCPAVSLCSGLGIHGLSRSVVPRREKGNSYGANTIRSRKMKKEEEVEKKE